MLRKTVGIKAEPGAEGDSRHLNIASLASVVVTSETPDHPIDNAFDGSSGIGGSYWEAADSGEQTVSVVFDSPQTIEKIVLEVFETETSRAQQISVYVSRDKGATYSRMLTQGFNFSPPSTIREHEEWTVTLDGVTNVKVTIVPDLPNGPGKAKLTQLAFL